MARTTPQLSNWHGWRRTLAAPGLLSDISASGTSLPEVASFAGVVTGAGTAWPGGGTFAAGAQSYQITAATAYGESEPSL
jgi:hypothetical protein